MQDKVNCTLISQLSKLLIKEEKRLLNRQRMQYVSLIDWDFPIIPKRSIVSSPVVPHLYQEDADIPQFQAAIESLSKTELGLVRKLAGMSTCCKSIYITQTTLGKDVGYSSGRKEYCRETVNRLLKKLSTKGIIEVTNRGVKRSCLYRVSPLLFRKELQGFLLKFFIFLIGNLFPQSGYPQVKLYDPKVTQNDIYKEGLSKSESSFQREMELLVTITNHLSDLKHRKRTFSENREHFSINPGLSQPEMGETNSEPFFYIKNLLHPHADRVLVEDVDDHRPNSAMEQADSANIDPALPICAGGEDTIRMSISDGIYINIKKEEECLRRNAPQAPSIATSQARKPTFVSIGSVLDSFRPSMEACRNKVEKVCADLLMDLHLTPEEKIELSSYRPHVLEFATKALKKNGRIKRTFGYLKKICEDKKETEKFYGEPKICIR